MAVWDVANDFERVHLVEMEEAVTAVAVAPVLVNNRYLVAVGLESGMLKVMLMDPKESYVDSIHLNKE